MIGSHINRGMINFSKSGKTRKITRKGSLNDIHQRPPIRLTSLRVSASFDVYGNVRKRFIVVVVIVAMARQLQTK